MHFYQYAFRLGGCNVLTTKELSTEILNKINKVVATLSIDLEADIFLFSGVISETTADRLIEEVRDVKERQKNAVLILTTYGGDPNAAFRAMRCLQRRYDKISLYVYGYCKSAGTLMALGADKIVMSDFGEFGPLDVQVFKSDELYGRSSGLDIHQALNVIGSQAYTMFEDYFIDLIERTQGVITTKTATDVASSMAVQLLAPITAQIDPLRLGELNRVMRVAQDYGRRLSSKVLSQNRMRTIEQLTSGYHAHGFVIDYEEAKQLFQDVEVREPTKLEHVLENLLLSVLREPAPSGQEMIMRLKPTSRHGEEEYEKNGTGNGEQGIEGDTTGDVPGYDGQGQSNQRAIAYHNGQNHRAE